MIESTFDVDMLYSKVARYYVDKKGYSKEQANSIAQSVVLRETERRTCQDGDCRHMLHDHIRNTGTCLVPTCSCAKFKK